MEWQRARSREQKEHRVAEIITAAARLYKIRSFEEITFTAIAKEAAFTRSNLYKYFNSKEEIFLEFLKHDIGRWRKNLETAFRNEQGLAVKQFARRWVKVQAGHERLVRLFSVLYTSLEKKSSARSLIEFKRTVNQESAAVSELLRGLFPGLTFEKTLEFLNLQLAAAIGLYQMTDLSEAQKTILEDPEFKHFKLDFQACFEKTVESLLLGLGVRLA
jgi:AcrR family transcriptional regulator